MSSASDADQNESDVGFAPKAQTSGGEDSTPPPGDSEQEEAELMGPSTSTVFVAGGSGFVGSEICSQVRRSGGVHSSARARQDRGEGVS